MKKALPFIFTCFSIVLFSQEYIEVTYANSYSQQAFYRLADDGTTNIDNDSWEIALSITGSGIFINETAEVFAVENALYLAPTGNFEDVVGINMLSDRIFNNEKSWDDGGFNSPKDENDPNDTGWGIYDPMTGATNGNRVFVVRLKNGNYLKLQISLDQGIYTVRYAGLDGSNETTVNIDQADFSNNHFAYLSLISGQTLDNVPSDWDLLFTRYSALLDDGNGGTTNIMTSGVLSAPGVEVAEARGFNPDDVEYSVYMDSLGSEIDIIGFDWKDFDNVSWTLADDLAFFVKNPVGQVWKLVFLSFGGSSTGNVIFEKTPILIDAVTEPSAFDSFGVFPNPLSEFSTAVFSIKQQGEVELRMTNSFGQQIWAGKQNVDAGLNAVALPHLDIPSGIYYLSVHFGGEILTKKVSK